MQAILSGKRVKVKTLKKFNPIFPLRHITRCGVCGTPLTAALCRGRSKSYPYYWCPKKSCRAVKLTKEQLEVEFLQHLASLRANPSVVAEFPKVAAEVWKKKQGDHDQQAKRLRKQLEAQKVYKSGLLKLRVDGELSPEEFKDANDECARNIFGLDEQLRTVEASHYNAEAFAHFAQLQLLDISKAWQIAKPEQRERVQNLLFDGGLEYSPKTGILNRSKSSIFSMLEAISKKKSDLVELIGIEPMTSSLRTRRSPS